MTDNNITKVNECKTLAEGEKIKAIYPHIVVSGDINEPYYSIHWYDIEQKTMICGYGSYKLAFVKKWLQEDFEVVEGDIDNLINRQKAEIETLERKLYDEGEALLALNHQLLTVKAETSKEFAKRLKDVYTSDKRYDRPNPQTMLVKLFDNIAKISKELAGED